MHYRFYSDVKTMKINASRMAEDLEGGYLNATDLADYLAAKGLPFRSAPCCIG